MSDGRPEPKLSKRLGAILKAAGRCDCIADIGTDHGFLPIAAVVSGRAVRAVACDLRKGPLERCRANVSLYGAEGRVDVRLADGADALKPGEADCVVIAGMGGLLVAGLLERGISAGNISPGTKLVLSPNSHEEDVRRLVYGTGFSRQRESCVREEDRIYLVISCVYSGEAGRGAVSRPEWFYYTGGGGLPKYYYGKVCEKARRRLEGLEVSSAVAGGSGAVSGEMRLLGSVISHAGDFRTGAGCGQAAADRQVPLDTDNASVL